jgi:hypothetical protein
MKRILYTISTLKNYGPVNQLYNLIKNPIILDNFKIEILTLSKEESNSRKHDFEDLNIKIYNLNMPKKLYQG